MLNDNKRLIFANRELRTFLNLVDALVQGRGDVVPADLRAIGRLLQSMAPEIGDPASRVSEDAERQALIEEYADSLRAVQTALEQVRCVMLARLTQMSAEQGRLGRLQGWARAYQQTA